MTELLSQAYSKGKGIFTCPKQMQLLVRSTDDPLQIFKPNSTINITGAANIIDLANLYSCSFLATDDAVSLHPNNDFEILGRVQNSDVRGCGLMLL